MGYDCGGRTKPVTSRVIVQVWSGAWAAEKVHKCQPREDLREKQAQKNWIADILSHRKQQGYEGSI